MTVCIAALALWNYAKPGDPDDWGLVGITASDRMITFGDVQYEPVQQKIALLGKTILLISGDYSLHSEAIKTIQHDFKNRRDASPHDIALMYGRTLQSIKRRQAEDIFLAPLGLNTDLLFSQQNDMPGIVVERLVTQLQNYQGEAVEAIVIGIEVSPIGRQDATIYHVDTHGSVSCADDVGFTSIGGGAWHANSQLMQAGFNKRFLYFNALAVLFAAKKAADVSPGVGSKFTDINVLFRDGPEPLLAEQLEKLEELYVDFDAKRAELARQAVNGLTDFVIKRGDEIRQQNQGQAEASKKSDGDADPEVPATGDGVGDNSLDENRCPNTTA